MSRRGWEVVASGLAGIALAAVVYAAALMGGAL